MNRYDPTLDEIIALKKELHQLFVKHYVQRELFSANWWITLAMLTVPLFLWRRTVDRKRLREILLFGFACNIIATILDVILSDYLMWEYPVHLLPQISVLIPVDYVIVPVMGMYLYQKFPGWGPFLLAGTLTSAAMSFLCEPLAVATHMYRLISWRYVDSFPIYSALYAAVKLFTQKVVRAEAAGQKPENR